VLVPGALGLFGDGVPVHEGALVELLAGEVADGGVHAVLRAQHHHRVPRALQPLEQTRAVPAPRPPRQGVGKEGARGGDGTGRQYPPLEGYPAYHWYLENDVCNKLDVQNEQA
jgi:hypothetical protein